MNVAAHFTEYLIFGVLLVWARHLAALGWGKLALVAVALASLLRRDR